jgi:flavodoxin
MSLRRGLLVTVVVAAIVVVAAVGVSLGGSQSAPANTTFEAFDTNEAVSEPLPRGGSVNPDPSIGTGDVVLVDDSNGNRFTRADIGPLTEGIGRSGARVQFHETGEFEDALETADALVVVDPATAYSESEIDAIDAFVDDGGRLLILAEPTRTSISGGLLGTQLTAQESELTGLGSRFDVQFDTRYVYDQTQNDGTYQQVVAEPSGDGALSDSDTARLDADAEIAFSVASEVQSTGDGDPVLVSGETARTAGTDDPRRHTLAVRDGNVLAVGDTSFATAGRYDVGDNEAFLTGIVEFLVGADEAGASSTTEAVTNATTGGSNATANTTVNATAGD